MMVNFSPATGIEVPRSPRNEMLNNNIHAVEIVVAAGSSIVVMAVL